MAKGKWVVYTLDETKAGRRWIAGPSFASKEAAEKQAHEYRGPGGVPTEVKFVSTTADPTTAGPWAGQIKPPKSERGLSRQRRRQEAERITKKVKITDDKIDLSELTSAEKARIKQITGVKAEDAFEIKQTPTTKVEFEKSLLSKQRAAETTQKIEARKQQQAQEVSLSTGGVPLTILGDPGRMAVERTDLSGGFAPDRPISPGETMQLAPPQLKREKTLFDIGGEIQPKSFKAQEFNLGGLIPGDIERISTKGEIQTSEKYYKSIEAGGFAAFEAELFTTGIPKAIEVIPEALAFGALAAFSPPAAIAVGTVAMGVSAPGLQEEILTKGPSRTVASELPSLGVFALFGGAGARLRTTKFVREAKGEIQMEQLRESYLDPGFTFESKPFVFTGEKPPPYLQRTLKGEVITPKQEDILLQEIRATEELPPPTTPKELRKVLRRRASLTREQAGQLDIFTPKIEENLLIEPSREGLVTPGKIGRRERQLQLRESYPTIAQKAAFALANIPKQLPPPTKQLRFFPGKKGQAGLIFRDFDIGGIFRGAGEGIRRFGEFETRLPPEITKPRTRTRIGVFPAVSDYTDQFTGQRARQLQEQILGPSQIQETIQRTKPLEDIDILQDQITEPRVIPKQDIFQEQQPRQRVTPGSALVEMPITDPITDIIDDPITDIIGEPEKPKRIKRTIFGFDEFTGVPAIKEGYDVIIREKGQDIELDKKKSFPRHRALNMGADIVDNSAAASFRIKKSKQPIASNIDDPFFILGHKFRSPARKSKLPPKQFIEKTGFRIDSPGELKGITAKGLIASRRKAAKSRALDFGFSGGFGL